MLNGRGELPFKGVLKWLHVGRGLLRGSFGDEGRDLAWRAEWVWCGLEGGLGRWPLA